MVSKDELRPIVREVLETVLAGQAGAPTEARGAALVNADEVMAARHQGSLEIPEGAIVTPLARDAAERFGVRLLAPGERAPQGPLGVSTAVGARVEAQPRAPAPYQVGGTLAIGADHGGFDLKERIRGFLARKGRFAVVDHGSYDKSSCDYPDIACGVARAVAMGEAQFGILIDGAGIGSCMAANKVPGVLAANCHSPATARNSREHNGANVLCLGSGHLDTDAGLALVDAWLSTPFGGGRHGRRVAKIRAIEQSFMGQE